MRKKELCVECMLLVDLEREDESREEALGRVLDILMQNDIYASIHRARLNGTANNGRGIIWKESSRRRKSNPPSNV